MLWGQHLGKEIELGRGKKLSYAAISTESSDHHIGSSETRLTLSKLGSGGWAFYIHEDLSLDMGHPEERGVTLVR